LLYQSDDESDHCRGEGDTTAPTYNVRPNVKEDAVEGFRTFQAVGDDVKKQSGVAAAGAMTHHSPITNHKSFTPSLASSGYASQAISSQTLESDDSFNIHNNNGGIEDMSCSVEGGDQHRPRRSMNTAEHDTIANGEFYSQSDSDSRGTVKSSVSLIDSDLPSNDLNSPMKPNVRAEETAPVIEITKIEHVAAPDEEARLVEGRIVSVEEIFPVVEIVPVKGVSANDHPAMPDDSEATNKEILIELLDCGDMESEIREFNHAKSADAAEIAAVKENVNFHDLTSCVDEKYVGPLDVSIMDDCKVESDPSESNDRRDISDVRNDDAARVAVVAMDERGVDVSVDVVGKKDISVCKAEVSEDKVLVDTADISIEKALVSANKINISVMNNSSVDNADCNNVESTDAESIPTGDLNTSGSSVILGTTVINSSTTNSVSNLTSVTTDKVPTKLHSDVTKALTSVTPSLTSSSNSNTQIKIRVADRTTPTSKPGPMKAVYVPAALVVESTTSPQTTVNVNSKDKSINNHDDIISGQK